ncbi:MAG: D-tyrosyl-tRNA(Tyr) deacylase [Chloroflexi bacterium]|nr:D-tyrosyl-tRNA(Tyr) deacylase [Chloroflexota bacterium]
MRLVAQRVSRASVSAGEELLGRIGLGSVLLVGIGRDDDAEAVDRMADRVVGLRYFRDADGRTNLAAADVGASFLVVSQFTLYADTSRGRRPGFTDAAAPELAATLVDRFAERLREGGFTVESGRFGAEMAVELINDGPFTLVLDSG